ncbi:MAG: tetratricopeptide repeat protein [Gemmatimonadaceae bacterium]
MGMTRRLPSWAPPLAIAILALAASGRGLANGFAYDDQHVIVLNARVHSLHRWWILFGQSYWPPSRGAALYRPLTSLGFAAQWVVGGGTPWIFHAVSTLLYVGASVAVFWLAAAVLPLPAATVAAAIFAVHPVHVEAVGNVVGQGELLAGMAVIVAASLYLRARARGPLGGRIATAIALLFVIGGLSKEHALVLPALLLAAECLLVTDIRPLGRRVRGLLPLYGALAVIGFGLLGARYRVLGTLAGDTPTILLQRLPWLGRVVTMVGVVPEYLRLLVWPARLSADYSPQRITESVPSDPNVLVGLLLLVAIGGIAVASLKSRPVLAFGVAWAAIALLPVSNLLFVSGVIVAERTLFLPSVGFAVACGAVAMHLIAAMREASRRTRLVVAAVAAAVIIAGTVRSALRQRVWHDNDTLFAQMLVDAPQSYRARWAHAAYLFEQGDTLRGERELRKAITLFPYDGDPMMDLANKYRARLRCEPAEVLYRAVLNLNPVFTEARRSLAACLVWRGEFAAARQEAQTGLAYGYAASDFRILLAIADSALAVKPAKRG